MSVARPSDGLLPASTTIALIELLAARSSPTEAERLIRDLAAIAPISWSRARNTIAKLFAYGVIRSAGTGVVAIGAKVKLDWRAVIARQVASELTIALTRANAWSCLRLGHGNGTMTIDAMLLPSLPDGLGMWITDFGVAERPSIGARLWTVAADHRSAFLVGASNANHAVPRRSKSAERLAAELARQAEDGAAAEEWVRAFERQRLRGHPLQEQVRRISVDDVAAGYDILSFSTTASLRHDLFIEVKSYAGRKAFHWSRNEIATAQEFGEAYALYLVDRTRCVDDGYLPHIIMGPSPEMFALPDSGWRVEATSFEHIAVSDH
jgi:hypothetical protein